MPRYTFVCEPCEEHDERIIREVIMPISHFDEEGKLQTCDRCLKLMTHQIGMPAVHYKGKGFYKTDYPRPLPAKEVGPMEKQLEAEYIDRAKKNGDYDAAREQTETYVVDRYKDTTTGKKVYKPVEVPPIKD